jgi:signal transduction histidine kinase
MKHRVFSLRMKLTLWFLLIFVAIQATLTTAALSVRQRKTGEFLDTQLLKWERAISRRLAVKQPRWTWTEEYLAAAVPLDVDLEFVVIRDAEGHEVVSIGDVDTRYLPPPEPGADATAARPHLSTIEAEQAAPLARVEEPLRLVTASFQDRGGDPYVLQAAASTAALAGLPAPGLDLLILAGPISLFAAGVAAWFLAGRAVAPMRQLGEAMRSVSPETIETRVGLERQEHEITRLQTELNEALGRLEEGYRAQERFISNVAHDLQTPIAVMITQSQVLNPASSSLTEYEEYRRSIEEEMRRLGGLVESFLTLAQADQGEALARREPVRIPDIVVETVEHCDPEAQLYEVKLVPNIVFVDDRTDAVLTGDPELLCAMLDNVVRNAIRFSPTRERVEIEAVCTDHEAILTVHDRGPGIPEEYLSKIFDRFVRAPVDAVRPKGTGLGLAIARSVAELHEGRIAARNAPEGGCIFEIRLPLDPQPPEPG